MACIVSTRCHWHTTNRFRYLYPAPVTRVVTRLRLLPRPQHGTQQVVHTQLHIDPHPRAARSWADRFGNCVLEVEHERLPTHLEVARHLEGDRAVEAGMAGGVGAAHAAGGEPASEGVPAEPPGAVGGPGGGGGRGGGSVGETVGDVGGNG